MFFSKKKIYLQNRDRSKTEGNLGGWWGGGGAVAGGGAFMESFTSCIILMFLPVSREQKGCSENPRFVSSFKPIQSKGLSTLQFFLSQRFFFGVLLG